MLLRIMSQLFKFLKDDFAKEFTKAMEENNTLKEEVESLRLGLSIACRGIGKIKNVQIRYARTNK